MTVMSVTIKHPLEVVWRLTRMQSIWDLHTNVMSVTKWSPAKQIWTNMIWSFYGGSWLWLCIFIGIFIGSLVSNNQILDFSSLSWFWRWKKHLCPLSPDLGFSLGLVFPDWGLANWSWLGYSHWPLIHIYGHFWLSVLIYKVQRTSMIGKSSFGVVSILEGPNWGL